MTRGVLVGAVTYAAVWIMQITPFHVANLFAIVFFSVIASLLMGAVGLIGGIWADKFDHMAAVQNFVIMPLTMLSGTFYPIGRLPEPFVTISHFNPFFQIIDGFRYGFTGHAESDLLFGGAMSTVITLALVRVVLGAAEARVQAEGVASSAHPDERRDPGLPLRLARNSSFEAGQGALPALGPDVRRDERVGVVRHII